MQTILLQTEIAAPIERCFLLSLSIDLHLVSTGRTNEHVIGGVTRGLIGPNQTVEFQAHHFGFTLTHESRITAYTEPTHFRDEMIAGMFKSFLHDHNFEPTDDSTTIMRDTLRFAAPFGVLGGIAERLVLRRYLTGFLQERNAVIKRIAESPTKDWRRYISE